MAATDAVGLRAARLPRRHVVGALCFGAFLIGYMDRANISVTAPVMMESLVINAVDLGPRHAGTLNGVSATASDLAGTLAPIVAGRIIESALGWGGVFCLAAGLLVVGGSVWLAFAEAEETFR